MDARRKSEKMGLEAASNAIEQRTWERTIESGWRGKRLRLRASGEGEDRSAGPMMDTLPQSL